MLLLCTYLHGKVALARVALFASCRLRLLLQYDFFEKEEMSRCLVNVWMSYAFDKSRIWGVFFVQSLGWFDKTPWNCFFWCVLKWQNLDAYTYWLHHPATINVTNGKHIRISAATHIQAPTRSPRPTGIKSIHLPIITINMSGICCW